VPESEAHYLCHSEERSDEESVRSQRFRFLPTVEMTMLGMRYPFVVSLSNHEQVRPSTCSGRTESSKQPRCVSRFAPVAVLAKTGVHLEEQKTLDSLSFPQCFWAGITTRGNDGLDRSHVGAWERLSQAILGLLVSCGLRTGSFLAKAGNPHRRVGVPIASPQSSPHPDPRLRRDKLFPHQGGIAPLFLPFSNGCGARPAGAHLVSSMYFFLTLKIGSFTNELSGGEKWFKRVESGDPARLGTIKGTQTLCSDFAVTRNIASIPRGG
jgi:hypothetical protein